MTNTEKKKKIPVITYTVVFLAVTVLIDFLSLKNLIKPSYTQWNNEGGVQAPAFLEKFQFVNFNGVVKNVLGQREMNGITKLNNGHLIKAQEKKSDEEIKAAADEVIKFAEYCEGEGIPFLFVQPILNVDEDNKQLPTGVEDYSNENIDVFLEYLREADVEVLDLRESMKNDGMDMYDYTYVTDHHWTTEGAFYAFTKISKRIDDHLGIETNPLITDLDNYEIQKYPQWHLGSYGQRCGQYFATADDYDLILPAFDVEFEDGKGNAQSFYDAVVDPSVFANKDATSRYTYDHAVHCPEGVATTSNDCKVMFVSDSYSTAMIPFLKLAYSDYISQYYPQGFSAEAVRKSQPDMVVLMPFDTSTFDERADFTEE